MAGENNEIGPPTLLTFLGVTAIVAVTLGMYLIYRLAVTRIGGEHGYDDDFFPAAQPPGVFGHVPVDMLPEPLPMADLSTFTLGTLGTTDPASTIAMAPAHAEFDIVLTVPGPLNSFAVVGWAAQAIEQVNGSSPAGRGVVIIRDGDNPYRMRLKPGQYLYAKGSVAGTLLSVSTSARRPRRR